MSKLLTLRLLVNERLTAAAEEIFVLFERTIAEYEEELCRSLKENHRKLRILHEVNPRVLKPRARAEVQIPSLSPAGPGLNQEITETAQIKEDPEEARLPRFAPESSAVCVKTEESSLVQLRQTEHREETQEDITSETHFYTETEGEGEQLPDNDNDDNWKCPISPADAQMETEADGDNDSQVQIRDRSTAAQNSGQSPEYNSVPETSAAANSGAKSGTDEETDRKKHQCFVCEQEFENTWDLQAHINVHIGDGPHSSPACDKAFDITSNLINKIIDRPYSCLYCTKTFTRKDNLDKHTRIHTGEKPYSCSFCEKTFARKDHLVKHRRIHTGEKPYCCPICKKLFARKDDLDKHERLHTGEKPYSCSFCKKEFARRDNLDNHIKVHTGEKPFICSLCNKGFSQSGGLKAHMETHTKRSQSNAEGD